MKQGWEIKKLGEVLVKTETVDPTKKPNEKFTYLDVSSVNKETKEIENATILLGKEAPSRARKLVKTNDVIFATVRPTHNRVALITEEYNEQVCSTGYFVLRGKDFIFNQYLFYFLLTDEFNQQMEKLQKGASYPAVTDSEVKSILLRFPKSLPEQKRIIAILDEAFASIAKAKANAEQNLKNAKELFDVYLHKYYTSKEDGWEVKKLKEVAEYFNGLTYSPKDVNNEGIIVLRSSNVQNDELDFKDIVRVNLAVKEKIIVKEGDILMCSRNGSARLVGKTATIKNLDEEMTFGTFMMIIRSQYNPYLSWFFKSSDFRNQIKGGENTMINQITRYMLDDVTFSFPPIVKQNEIVQKLDALSLEIKKLDIIYNQKLDDLEELKKSVLQRAFSGELK